MNADHEDACTKYGVSPESADSGERRGHREAGIRKNGIYEFHGLEEKIVESDRAVSAKPPAKMSCPPTRVNML